MKFGQWPLTLATLVSIALPVSFLGASCPSPSPTPATGGTAGTGGSTPVATDCELAEARIRELNCCQVDGYRYDTCPDDDSGFPLWEVPAVAGEPVKSFVDACEHSLEQGRDWCAGALAEIVSCGEIDAAMRSCK